MRDFPLSWAVARILRSWVCLLGVVVNRVTADTAGRSEDTN